ncbi:MAG TPA: aminotransferase class V-fold PLP-dependent enzyme [Solirubrobacteraceae bacterium]|nr:aminotransferase class V-fold PLP-dependent enzyme [Solirubrobacteraceae bacterium]
MSIVHIEPESLGAAEAAFRREQPGYAATGVLDELRASDFARLDRGGHVYLDYTGGGLYAQSQLTEHLALLRENVFGNPHSVNSTSAASTELVERARDYVLGFFNASPEEYVAIFTPNATGALRLVGEAYPFRSGDRFLLTFDNHNSVNGIREFARTRGAETSYIPSVAPDLRVAESVLARYLTDTPGGHHNLFAYPAQSNFSGVQHPLEWIEQAHAHGWEVLLDAAAYVPTNRLDLSRWHPDFVALSFYKMFGWPTGVGCLLARRDALAKLERPWFSGGTIVAAFVQREYYQSAPGAAHFEDGTVNYLDLPAVEIGLRLLDRIGLETIHARVSALGAWLLHALGSLAHSDGSSAATIYGPRSWEQRGATIAFNFRHPDGRIVDERYVDRIARQHNVSLRTGCFCNPGAGEVAFTISRETLVGGEFGEGMTLDDYVRAIGLPSGGAIRASLGLASNFQDIHRFMSFADEFVDLADVPNDLPPRIAC